jgi:hypothetical protein
MAGETPDHADHGTSSSSASSTPADTSAAPTPSSTTSPSVGPDAKLSPSSSEKGETRETLLQAVEKALPELKDSEDTLKLGEDTPPSNEPGSEAKKDGEPGEPDLSKDPTEEELARYNQNGAAKRIRKLLDERLQLREQVKGLDAEAQISRSLKTYLQTHDIAKEDFQLTLDLAAAMRAGNFRQFLEGVGPYVQLATEALGLTLPNDIQQSVARGQMTVDAGAALSRERYARALAEQNATRLSQEQRQFAARHQSADLSRSVEQAVTAWENQVRTSDPDYGRKEATVRQFLWAVINERGSPQSPEHAVEIAREAYERATNTLREFAPAPRPTRQTPSSIGRTAAGARPEPKTLMEAALLGLERAQRAAN